MQKRHQKNAMGWYLDGRVSAVVGTHTHSRLQMNEYYRMAQGILLMLV